MKTIQDFPKLIEQIHVDMQEIQQELVAILGSNIKLEGNPNAAKIDEQLKEKAATLISAYQTDIERGVQCFLEYTHTDEHKRLGEIFGKLQATILHQAGIGPENPITDDDYAFLDQIAMRTLREKHWKEASCLFRLIIQLNVFYSRAWVGCACAEQEMHHNEIADQIYTLATLMLPFDPYIAAFAADFYVSQNQRTKAREVLTHCIEQLQKTPDFEPMYVKELTRQRAGI